MPTNWDELKAAAPTLTRGDRGLAVSGVKSEEGTFQWLPFLWETGEDLDARQRGRPAALQLWVDLVKAGQMSPASSVGTRRRPAAVPERRRR